MQNTNGKLNLPELHQISSDCVRNLLNDTITEPKANAVAKQASNILKIIGTQLQYFKSFDPPKFEIDKVLYGNN